MKWASGENLPRTHAKPTFSEAWLHQNYGLDFGERYHTDAVFRTEQDRETRKLLWERFGHLGLGEKDPQPRPHLEICGHRFLPALLGCEIIFQEDQAPASVHIGLDRAKDLARFKLPDLQKNVWAREFREQAVRLMDRYGTVDATINHGGPINVASNVLGTEAFVYLIESPEPFRAFLQTIADLCILTYDQLTLPMNPELGADRELFLGNCPVMMLDPGMYVAEVLPADLSLRSRVKRFGLHHCGPIDRYLGAYQRLEPLEYLEVGSGSDLSEVRRAFPTTLLDLLVGVSSISAMSESQMRTAMTDLIGAAEPTSLVRDVFMADVGADVEDSTIETFVESVDAAFAG